MVDRRTIVFSLFVMVMVLATQIERSESLFVPNFVENWFRLCGCPSTSKCDKNCVSKFSATSGRCAGLLNRRCECQIADQWVSKSRQC